MFAVEPYSSQHLDDSTYIQEDDVDWVRSNVNGTTVDGGDDATIDYSGEEEDYDDDSDEKEDDYDDDSDDIYVDGGDSDDDDYDNDY